MLGTKSPLTAVAYTGGANGEAFVTHFAVGEPVPDMPLFLTPENYVRVPLEAAYMAAWEGVRRSIKRCSSPRPDSPKGTSPLLPLEPLHTRILRHRPQAKRPSKNNRAPARRCTWPARPRTVEVVTRPCPQRPQIQGIARQEIGQRDAHREEAEPGEQHRHTRIARPAGPVSTRTRRQRRHRERHQRSTGTPAAIIGAWPGCGQTAETSAPPA